MRKALLSHPFKLTMNNLFTPSFGRIYCVFMMGSLEAMIKEWGKKENNEILNLFFKKNASNIEAINDLYNAFVVYGIPVDKEILHDYLAIKYLRNTIVHSGWKKAQEDFILERGFPVDSRELTEEHLEKMIKTNESMMLYIASTSFVNKRKVLNEEWAKGLTTDEKRLEKVSRVVHKAQLPALYWNNLENLSSLIEAKIKEKEVDFLLSDSQELVYLGEESLFFWKEYKKLKSEENTLNLEEILKKLKIIKQMYYEKSFLKLPTGISIVKSLHSELVKNPNEWEGKMITLFEGDNIKLAERDMLEALIFGEEMYNTIFNNSLLRLFLIQLPTIIPNKTKELLEESQLILNMYELSRYYYNYMEKVENDEPLKRNLLVYRQKLVEMTEN